MITVQDEGERDRVRERFAGTPGEGGQVEALLGERENAVAHGHDGRVEGVDSQLAQHGYTAEARAAADRARAAAERKAAAAGAQKDPPASDAGAGKGGDDTTAGAKRSPPAGRQQPPRQRA